jgi:hypothetical protein
MDASIIFTQGVIPLGLLFWQGAARSQSQLGWLLKTLLVAAYLGGVSLIGLWAVLFPVWMPYLYWLAWAAIAVATWAQSRNRPRWPKRNGWVITRVLVCGLGVGLFGAVIVNAAMGYLPPNAEPISLTFPFRDGTYYVANGGSNILLNGHLKTLASERFHNYRGQSYGLDLTKLNAVGLRSPGLLPKDLESYEIFGETVYAPCDGTVVATANDRPDLTPPQTDRDHLEGNFVLLRCKADVLLAHFKQSSVLVIPEESVATGQALGAVGNSGNTTEPHLHIHAQRSGSAAAPIDGDPLPILFGDRYLVRNARITNL